MLFTMILLTDSTPCVNRHRGLSSVTKPTGSGVFGYQNNRPTNLDMFENISKILHHDISKSCCSKIFLQCHIKSWCSLFVCSRQTRLYSGLPVKAAALFALFLYSGANKCSACRQHSCLQRPWQLSQGYVLNFAQAQKFVFFRATAKLFCRNGVMLPLGKHLHFAV